MPPVGNSLENAHERLSSVISDFNAATTVKEYRRARRRAGFLPLALQFEVLDFAVACHRRVLPELERG